MRQMERNRKLIPAQVRASTTNDQLHITRTVQVDERKCCKCCSCSVSVCVLQPLDEVLSRNLALAVKNSEASVEDREKMADITQSQDTTADVHCLRQVRPQRLCRSNQLGPLIGKLGTYYLSQRVLNPMEDVGFSLAFVCLSARLFIHTTSQNRCSQDHQTSYRNVPP